MLDVVLVVLDMVLVVDVVLEVVDVVNELAYRNSVMFHRALSRTVGVGRPHQDWAVAFGYDGAKLVAGWLITDEGMTATICQIIVRWRWLKSLGRWWRQ